jgi:hypothetical protein
VATRRHLGVPVPQGGLPLGGGVGAGAPAEPAAERLFDV